MENVNLDDGMGSAVGRDLELEKTTLMLGFEGADKMLDNCRIQIFHQNL